MAKARAIPESPAPTKRLSVPKDKKKAPKPASKKKRAATEAFVDGHGSSMMKRAHEEPTIKCQIVVTDSLDATLREYLLGRRKGGEKMSRSYLISLALTEYMDAHPVE